MIKEPNSFSVLWFGLGDMTNRMLPLVKQGFLSSIQAFIDERPEKQGAVTPSLGVGLPVIGLKELRDYTFDYIFVCARPYENIADKLRQVGVPKEKIVNLDFEKGAYDVAERRLAALNFSTCFDEFTDNNPLFSSFFDLEKLRETSWFQYVLCNWRPLRVFESIIKEAIFSELDSWNSEHNSLYNRMQRRAFTETEDFIEKNMPDAVFPDTRERLLEFSLQKVTTDGLFMEFGVWKGYSINVISKIKSEKTIYGFDSFYGLPEDWTGYTALKGRFSTDGILPDVNKNVVLIKGLFEDTLPAFLDSNKNTPVAFLHCDADLYTSTKTILKFLGDRITAGTVIVFDEFFNYPGWRRHEYKAFKEFCQERNVYFRYLAAHTFRVALIIDAID
ncbi:hypothetical protein FACS1894205_1240 [Alphaproteobacteria bacterium]|nr:hypothetical protein FACS1894205_1240 [Alphaproteobacteria bacterium]